MTEFDQLWALPPANLTLSPEEVHVWRVALDQPASYLQRLKRTLSADERLRAEHYCFEQDSRRFIVGRGMLRTLLGRYVGIEPSRLQFCYGTHGKPRLAATVSDAMLRFNVSHSQGLALYAITLRREVGVDLERMRCIADWAQIAARFFSLAEQAALASVTPTKKLEAFYNCWTRKEAYIKARGEGLSLPLDQFDVALLPGEPAALLCTNDDPMGPARWSLRELRPCPGYVGPLAVEGHAWRLRCYQRPSSIAVEV